MTRRNRSSRAQITVPGKLIERVRREHKLTTATLAMLSGLEDAQVKAIEEGSDSAFVDEAHRIDCARRIALAMGLPDHHFLQMSSSEASAQRNVRQTVLPSSPEWLPREAWEQLPAAHLRVLAALRAIDNPSAPEQRRRGSPLVIALGVSLILTALMLGLVFLR
jgi:transcriptional regulator with XRE-family HTH domain